MANPSDELEPNLGIDKRYEDILEEIPPEAPRIFLKQAEEAARLFTLLDNDIGTPDTKILLETISQASFVGTFRARKPEMLKTSFPAWIVEEREKKKVGGFVRFGDDVIDAYNCWVTGNGVERSDPNGTYVDYGIEGIVLDDGSEIKSFKGYVPNDITAGGLMSLFETLKTRNVHPKVTKMFSELNRLVFYWTTPPNKELVSTLQELQITGIGEDSFRIINGSEGAIVRAAASRDRSLGSGVVDFRQDEFDKGKFFRNYLKQCLHWWRDPSNPGWMSYIPSEVDVVDISEVIKKDAKDMGLEIVYKPRNTGS